MNSFERKELKRALESRDNWKKKAMDRNVELRKEKKRIVTLPKAEICGEGDFFQ